MFSKWFGRWRTHTGTSAIPPPAPVTPADPAGREAIEAIQYRVIQWFAKESLTQINLAQATVPILVAARPRLMDARISQSHAAGLADDRVGYPGILARSVAHSTGRTEGGMALSLIFASYL